MDWLMSNLTLANFTTDAMDIWRGNGERKKERGRKREKERKKDLNYFEYVRQDDLGFIFVFHFKGIDMK